MKIQLITDLKYNNKNGCSMPKGGKIFLKDDEKSKEFFPCYFYHPIEDELYNFYYFLECEYSIFFNKNESNITVYNNMYEVINVKLRINFLSYRDKIKFITKITE